MNKMLTKFGLGVAVLATAVTFTSCEDENANFLDLRFGSEEDLIGELVGTYSYNEDNDAGVLNLLTFLDVNDLLNVEFGENGKDGSIDLGAILDGNSIVKFDEDALTYDIRYDLDGTFKITFDSIGGDLLEGTFVEIIIDGNYDIVGGLGEDKAGKDLDIADILMTPTKVTVKYRVLGRELFKDSNILNEEGSIVTVVGLDKDGLILDFDMDRIEQTNVGKDKDDKNGILDFLFDFNDRRDNKDNNKEDRRFFIRILGDRL